MIVPDLTRDPGKGVSDPIASPDLGPIPRMELPDGTREWGATGRSVQRVHEERARAERRRLFYVALTRARDYLILSSAFGVKKDGTLSGGVWLQWLVEGLASRSDHARRSPGAVSDRRVALRGYYTRGDRGAAAAPRSDARASLTTITEARAAGRGQSEPLPPLARSIPPGPLLPARFTVTALAHFRACPRWFELRHVLGRPEQSGGSTACANCRPWSAGTSPTRRWRSSGARPGPRRGAGAGDRTAPDGLGASRGPRPRRPRRAPLVPGGRAAGRWHTAASRLGRGRHPPAQRVDFAFCLDEALIEAPSMPGRNADGCCVLDYKTGGDPAAETLASYRFQVGLYCAAVGGHRGPPGYRRARWCCWTRAGSSVSTPRRRPQAQTEAARDHRRGAPGRVRAPCGLPR